MLHIHTSGVHPIQFRRALIWFHIALEHARITNNDQILDLFKRLTGGIHLQKREIQASYPLNTTDMATS